MSDVLASLGNYQSDNEEIMNNSRGKPLDLSSFKQSPLKSQLDLSKKKAVLEDEAKDVLNTVGGYKSDYVHTEDERDDDEEERDYTERVYRNQQQYGRIGNGDDDEEDEEETETMRRIRETYQQYEDEGEYDGEYEGEYEEEDEGDFEQYKQSMRGQQYEDEEEEEGEDDYVVEYIPFVNKTYKTVGDHQFDLAMKKLTKIFNQSSQMENDLEGEQDKSQVSAQTMSANQFQGIVGVDMKKYIANTPASKLDDSFGTPFMSPAPSEMSIVNDKWKSTAPGIDSQIQRSLQNMNASPISPSMHLEDDELPADLRVETESVDFQKMSRMMIDEHKPKNVKLNEKQWGNLIKRLHKPSHKRLRKMEAHKRKKEDKKTEHCTYQPKICKKSRDLVAGMASIWDDERIREEQDNMKARLENSKKIKSKLPEGSTFKPKINKASKGLSRGVETFEAWEENKRQKVKNQQEAHAEEYHKECTFQPQLSNRSVKIMKRKRLSQSVWDRNYEFEFQKMQKIHDEQERRNKSFDTSKPKITKKASTLKRKEKIGDRLHTLAMESINRKARKRRELFGKHHCGDNQHVKDTETQYTPKRHTPRQTHTPESPSHSAYSFFVSHDQLSTKASSKNVSPAKQTTHQGSGDEMSQVSMDGLRELIHSSRRTSLGSTRQKRYRKTRRVNNEYSPAPSVHSGVSSQFMRPKTPSSAGKSTGSNDIHNPYLNTDTSRWEAARQSHLEYQNYRKTIAVGP